MAFPWSKKRKLWIIKAIDRSTRRTIAWALGKRDVATFKRLYEKVKHLTNCTFYTDYWDAFTKALPKERHVMGKEHTIAIEQDNSNTRDHLAGFTRRTKVVLKKVDMVDLSLRLWCALTTPDVFREYRERVLCIFR